MFFTFAVYSIILALGSEVGSLEHGSTLPSSGTESSPQHDNHYFSTFPGYTISSPPYSTLTTKANTLPTESTATTGRQNDLDLASRSDEYNYRSTLARTADIHEDSESVDRGTTQSSVSASNYNSTTSMAAVYQEGPDHDLYTPSHLRTTETSSSPVTGSLAITSSGLQSANHEICDFCIYEGEGNFTSYGYPLPYRPNLDCSYRVQRTNSEDNADPSDYYCELDLIFHDFDVPVSSIAGVTSSPNENSNDCQEDYLLVAGRRFCGNGWRGRSEIIPFPANQKEVTFYFITNERVSGRGFWVEVKKRPGTCYGKKPMRACEERYSDTEFYITSPQFPSGYPNNADCTYHIRRADQSVCGLEFKFLHFDLEPGERCPFDYLQIDGQRFCGTMSPSTVKQIKFDDDQEVLIFHSDKQLPRSGFHLLVRQIRKCGPDPSLPPPPNCNICTSERSGTLVSYSYPNPYRNNLYCTYTLEKYSPDVCAVEMKFNDFDLVPSRDCSEDYLLLAGNRFCGTTLHSTTKVIEFGQTNNTVDMTLRTDGASNSRGFSATYRQIPCSSSPSALPSTSSPTSASSSPSPARDITPLPAKDKPITTNSVFCDRAFNEKHFLLQSYNYTNNYPNNLDCTYTVFKNTSKVCYLELTFLSFDVEASPQCQFDFLEINNVRLCGTLQRETTRTYIFDSHEKPIKFHSDNSSNRGGYLIRAEQLECHGDAIIRNMSEPKSGSPAADLIPDHPVPCDQLITESTFEIISPLYPSPYPRQSDCVYMVQKMSPSICRLEVTYYDFELQGVNNHGYCSYDYLDFNGIRMCGQVVKGSVRNYYFPEAKFAIRFHADSSISGRGFRLGVKQGECDPNAIDPPPSSTPPVHLLASTSPSPGSTKGQSHHCDQVFTEGFLELTSPGYPGNYPPSTDCRYTIIKKIDASPICQLEVNIVDLELNPSLDCSTGDQIEFEREKICESLPPNTVKLFPFERSEFVIRFQSRSDGLNSLSSARRRGFFLQVRQRECPEGFSATPTKSPPPPPPPPPSTTTLPEQHHFDPIPDKKRLEYCGQIIRNLKFELKSPLFPAPYESNLDCSYIIKRNHGNICFLDLFFLDFEVEEDKDCKFDYLSIHGKKYCGLIKPGAIQTYPFTNRSEIMVLFHTDRANSGRGFYIRGAQRECDPTSSSSVTYDTKSGHQGPRQTLNFTTVSAQSPSPSASVCEFCFASRDGEIKSYDHPSFYPANLDCNYRITALPNHCAVYLKFEVFDFEEPRNGICTEDYLEIEGSRYCGNQLTNVQKLIDFHGKPREVLLRLHSNSAISGKGFRINYAQIPCTNIGINQTPINSNDKPVPQIIADSSPISVVESNDKINGNSETSRRVPCDLVVFDVKFEVSTPGYPYAYPNHADCLFSIRRANYNVCKLRLEFVDFDVEPSLNCRQDHLDIEGERLCGLIPNNTIKEYDFHNYKLALRFRSDDYGSKRGFFIRGQQIDCYDYNKQSSSPYPSNSADFPLYSSYNEGRYHSKPYSSSPSFAGSSPSLVYPPASSSSSSLPHSVRNYPPSYPDSSNLPLDRTQSSLYNVYPPSPSQQARHSSITPITGPIRNNGGSSSQSIASSGRNQDPIHHQHFNPFTTSSCDKTITDTFFDIQSVNYPQRYTPGSQCSIIIKKSHPSVCHLDLLFINFDVGPSSCSTEYFSIDGERLCGTIESGTVKTFPFDLPEKFIFFRGDLGQGLGFNVRGRQVECGPSSSSSSSLTNPSPVAAIIPKEPTSRSFSSDNTFSPFTSVSSYSSSSSAHIPYCDQIFSSGDFTISSPNHPNNYPDNLYCRFTIRRPSSSICALDINFVNFDLEQSPGCNKDYLEIDGSKICGLLPPRHQRRYNYFNQEHEKTFIFRSDSSGSKSGFSLTVSQVTGCRPYSNSTNDLQRNGASTPSRSQCNECMKDLVGQITSDNYPNHYGNGVDCNYRIASAGPQYCKVTVYIRDMDIEQSEACDHDYLFVEGQRLCNTNFKPKEMTIYFPEFGPREITFSFHSDSKGTGRGFFLDYMQQSCSTSSPSLSPSTMSKSPFYPSNHVAKAVIQEIVETKVQVLDQRPAPPPRSTFHSVSAKDSIYVGDPSKKKS